MEKNKHLILFAVAVVVLIGGWFLFDGRGEDKATPPDLVVDQGVYGEVGTKTKLEEYVAQVRFNGGLYTELPMFVNASTTLGSPLTIQGVLDVFGATTVETFTQGGGVNATSTSFTTDLLVAADLDVENVIDYTMNINDLTLTLPTAAIMPGIDNPGDTRTIFIRNATTTDGIDLTIAGNTNMVLKVLGTSTKTIISSTAGTNYAKIEFLRRADDAVDALMSIIIGD